MRIVSAFLADHVARHDTRLCVVGGFPEWWNLPAVPSQQTVYMGIVVEVEHDEVDTDFTLRVKVASDAEGEIVGANVTVRRGHSTALVSGAPCYLTEALRLDFPFTVVGLHRVSILRNDELLWEIRFGARLLLEP
jgi:hypothetical protein